MLFLAALEAEGLIASVEDRLDTGELPDPDQLPILLAVSDNGAPMTADTTKAFMALCSIAQHFGRPGVPTDQAPIESFFGHVKAEWPQLETVRGPEVLAAELERVRVEGSTTPSVCTPPSTTSRRRTSTPDEEKPSAKHDEKGSPEPTRPAELHAVQPTVRRPTMLTDFSAIGRAKSETPQGTAKEVS